MELTPTQEDGLVEFVNISFGRAAASLSTLTNHRVLINMPKVGLYPIQDLTHSLAHLANEEIAIVSQIFTGAVAGNAVLLINYQQAVRLSHIFDEAGGQHDFLSASDREALTEIGNIVLNACLSTFGNILQVHITFTVPRLHIEGLDGLMRSLTVDQSELRYCLIVSTEFSLQNQTIAGYLVIVLGVDSLDRLIQAIDNMVTSA